MKKSRRKKDNSIKVTLGPYHVSRLVWAYQSAIAKNLLHIIKVKNFDQIKKKSPVLTDVVLQPLYENLSVLEPLMECYLNGRGEKTSRNGFNMGDGELFTGLRIVRRYIKKFPPRLEIFFLDYSAHKKRILANSPICTICKKRGASMHYSNAIVHEGCLEKVKAKYCEYCANLYMKNEERCSNKTECANYKLKAAVVSKNGPSGSISMQVPLEKINEAKQETKVVNSHYKEEN